MTAVWQHTRTRLGARLVLLALADYAHDDGTQAFPSVEALAQKAGISGRQVQRALREIEALGEIRREGAGPRNTVIWTITLPGLADPPASMEGDKLSGATNCQGDISDTEGRHPVRGGVTNRPPIKRIDPSVNRHTEPLAPPLAPPEKPARRKPKHAVDPAFRPDAALLAWTAAQGWDAQRVAVEIEKFHAHHEREATLTASEAASWRTWVLNGLRYDARDAARERARGHGAGNGREPDAAMAAWAVVVKVKQHEREHGRAPDEPVPAAIYDAVEVIGGWDHVDIRNDFHRRDFLQAYGAGVRR